MTVPPDFSEWPPDEQAGFLTLDMNRGEMIKAIAAEVGCKYESNAEAGNERVGNRLLAVVAVALRRREEP